jgi:hypothetical protein
MLRPKREIQRSSAAQLPVRPVTNWLLGLVLVAGSPSGMAAAGDENWDDRFAWAVLEGSQVRAVAISGSNVYFGGQFNGVGGTSGVGAGVRATNIALWNGRSWAAVGGGVNGQVYAIATRGDDVYVGGEFTAAGGVSATNVARWDGANWWAVGSGTDDRVYTLAFRGDDLYAGGQFTVAGGIAAKRIAKWNGTSWSDIGGGLGNVGAVRAIAFLGGDMYASGDFNFQVGTNTIRTIARWDGTNWNGLTGDLGTAADTAYAMAVVGNDLYVGGTFLTAGGITARRIARWNGSWSAVGEGITAASVGVFTMVANGTDLYVAGQINGAGGIITGNTAKWDGVSWSRLGLGILGVSVVNGLAMANGDLYVGGSFLGVGGGTLHTYSTARWDGNDWWALGQGMDNAVHALSSTGTNVYAGGWFQRAGGVDASNVGLWDGDRWSSLGNVAIASEVFAVVPSGSNVYVGGNFFNLITNGFGLSALGIARWNGTLWSALGAGLRHYGSNGIVRAIAVAADGTVYAGGMFNQAGGAAATNIARFFTNWQAVGTLPNAGVNGQVHALALLGSDLYVGGAFTDAGGVSAPGIARWTGTAWSALAGGLNGTVLALATNGAELYAGGSFTNAAAGITNVAKWDGSSWSALGSGLGSTTNDFVASIAVNGTDVYVGGRFTNAGGILANGIARWNGSAWSALGSGVAPGTVLNPPVVRALAFCNGDLYVGGSFVTAGGKPSYGFAIWHLPDSGPPPGPGAPLAGVSVLPGGGVVIAWNSVSNATYQIRSTTDLALPFTTFAGPILSGGATTSFTNSTTDPVRFFLIEQLP